MSSLIRLSDIFLCGFFKRGSNTEEVDPLPCSLPTRILLWWNNVISMAIFYISSCRASFCIRLNRFLSLCSDSLICCPVISMIELIILNCISSESRETEAFREMFNLSALNLCLLLNYRKLVVLLQ